MLLTMDELTAYRVSVLVTNQRVPTAVVIHPHGTHQHRFQLQQAGVFSGKQKPSNQLTS